MVINRFTIVALAAKICGCKTLGLYLKMPNDNDSAHISRNENFKVLALLEAAERMSKRN